ncbi:Ig-like domain-containing protein [Rathayibacter sp. VKM Ac-2760]|uniref:Ig-like domain-containing protein n=1 Tax=Rathayibacter sp. VKM Ac-2760 TaxID=2609253 RepID=UPI00131920F2|nr:Ig-like domain-containing protein [Rathayibacter sp. VKM Ac-2760]QHC58841.1 hypothetical protein GSU72_10000 [Rathayibacter sp. VKM Ac-2760]
MSCTTPTAPSARRTSTLLRALAVTAAAGIAVTAASFQVAPAASAAPAPVSAVSAPVAGGASTFGPDGTHYPSDTPDIRSGLSGLTVVDVAASGSAVRAALDALTPAQIAAGAVVRVAPGRIDDVSALDGYRNSGPKKVLITARDGYRSVTGGRWQLKDVTGITLMRFDIGSIDVKGATHSSFAWLQIDENWVGLTGFAGVPVHDVELIEVVQPESRLKSGDSAQIKAYAPEDLSGVLLEGDYIAPSYYLDAQYGGSHPARPHTDSLQIEGSGITGQVTVRDSVVFSSNNSAVIVGGVKNVAFDHSFLVAGSVAAQRYPFLKGGAGFPGAINGPGSLSAIQGGGGGNVTATDSDFIGSLQPVWNAVSNTRTNLSGKTARMGSFRLDSALGATTAATLDAKSPRPTPAYLAGIWDHVGTTAVAKPAAPAAPKTPVTPAPAVPAPAAPAAATPAPTEPAPTTPVSAEPAPTTPAATRTLPAPTTPAPSNRTKAPVADRTAPVVAITSPTTGAVLRGTATATLTATDDTAVTGVKLFLGSREVGDATSSDDGTWSLTTGTAGLRGTFALTARATDAAGNSTVSAPVSVTLR